MTRQVLYRDFTLCKALALVGLIGLAMVLGKVPRSEIATREITTEGAMLLPAVIHKLRGACDPGQIGVDL